MVAENLFVLLKSELWKAAFWSLHFWWEFIEKQFS